MIWLNAVMFHTPQLTPHQALALIAIATNANDDGLCWPSVATLAVKAHSDERNLRRTIKALEDAGLLSRARRVRSDGAQSSNIYQLSPSLLSCPEECRCPAARLLSSQERKVFGGEGAGTRGGGSTYPPVEVQEKNGQGIARTHAHARARVPYKAKESPESAPPQDAQNRPTNSPAEILRPSRLGNVTETQAGGIPATAEAPQSQLVTPKDRLFGSLTNAWSEAYLTHPQPGMLQKLLGQTVSELSPSEHPSFLIAFRTYVSNTGPQFINLGRFASSWRAWVKGVPPAPNRTPDAGLGPAFKAVFGSGL